MAKKISELVAAGSVADADELELNQSGTSSKATRAQIVAGLALASHTHTLADLSSLDANGGALSRIISSGRTSKPATTYLSKLTVVERKSSPDRSPPPGQHQP